MSKAIFKSSDLKTGLILSRLVRSSDENYMVKFSSGKLSIFSRGKRGTLRVEIEPKINGFSPDFESITHFLTLDRFSILESDFDEIEISFSDKGMVIKTKSDNQSRNSLLKKRNDNSKKEEMPSFPKFPDSMVSIRSDIIESSFKYLSFSSNLKKTKTEIEMKHNQIHFYPKEKIVMAHANTFASVISIPDVNIDFSIISSDIPVLRSFCSRLKRENVLIGQDSSHLYLVDPITNSYVSFSIMNTNKPKNFVPDQQEYKVEYVINGDMFYDNLAWALNSVEGTKRLTLDFSSENETLRMLNGDQEISVMPVKFIKGRDLRIDVKMDMLAGLVDSVTDYDLRFLFDHKESKNLIEITTVSGDEVRHFLASMPPK